MIPIENEKRIDWNAIRAEYIGGASYGDLAAKYKLSKSTVYQHAKRGGWQTLRTNAANEARTKTIQKIVDAAADVATIKAEAQRLLWQQLLKEIKNLPELIGTEMHQDITTLSYGAKESEKGKVTKRTDGGKRYKLTDLTRAYKDLSEDMPKASAADVEDLSPLVELLR